MLIYAFDPGPRSSGFVAYDTEAGAVKSSEKAIENEEALSLILDLAPFGSQVVVAVERVQAQGIAGNDIMRTCEWSARFAQAALGAGLRLRWHYRREVCRHLDVSGGGKDAQVRARCIELHGGDRRSAQGVKKAPGPLYGVSGHAWQALGLALLVADL